MSIILKYHYVYRIENLVNQNYYIGKHSTKKLDDGYLGSGKLIVQAVEKYGISNFKKTILKMFESEEDAYNYEKQLITDNVLKDPKCYNICYGGGNPNVWHSLNDIEKQNLVQKQKNSTKIARQNAKKLGIQFGQSHESHMNTVSKLRESGLYAKWSLEYSGYDNPDFLKRWKTIYEKDHEIITKYIIDTDIPTEDLFEKMFIKHCKTKRIIKYYESQGYIPENGKLIYKKRWTNSTEKHIRATPYHIDFGEKKKYEMVEIVNDFFNMIPEISLFLKDESCSNSTHENFGRYNFKFSSFEYFKDIGIIMNIRTVEVKVPHLFNGHTRIRKAPKIIFDWNFSGLNKQLYDKEMNIYGIDVNGQPFQKGKFEI